MQSWICRASVALVFLSALPACSPNRYIALSSDRYAPRFERDVSAYAGRSVYLMDIQDEDAEHMGDHFGGRQFETWYIVDEGYYPNFPSYFWYVFYKALGTAGMTVSDSSDPDLAAPHLQLTILRLDESGYRFGAQLSRYGRKLFEKSYEVSLPVLTGPERNETALEERIDRMASELIEAILVDPEFERAFLDSERAPVPSAKR